MRRSYRFFLVVPFSLPFVISTAGTDIAQAHHSWKCPPTIDVKALGADAANRVTLKVTATNNCGCSVKFTVCPLERKDKKNHEGCTSKWMVPYGTFDGTVVTEPGSGKAHYDWGTHSNDAPCN